MAFLDTDDIWYNKLQKQIEGFDSNIGIAHVIHIFLMIKLKTLYQKN